MGVTVANRTPITDGPPAKRQVTALAVDPRRAGTVGMYSWSGPIGIVETTDGVLTWNGLSATFPVTPDQFRKAPLPVRQQEGRGT